MVDVYAGTVVYRASLSREPLDDVVIDQIVNLLLHGSIPTLVGADSTVRWETRSPARRQGSDDVIAGALSRSHWCPQPPQLSPPGTGQATWVSSARPNSSA
jgi:hypothetical protein